MGLGLGLGVGLAGMPWEKARPARVARRKKTCAEAHG